MTIFWIAALFLIIVSVALTLWPLLARKKGQSALEHAIAFYEEQKTEIERQFEAGQISEDEKLQAEAEQARHLLAINRTQKEVGSHQAGGVRQKIAAIIALVLVPMLAIGIYLRTGQPNVPDLPLASRKIDPRTLNIEQALQKIEEHLLKNPGDAKGYEVVAPIYMRAGRYDDAANAFRRIIEITGETAPRLADLGESLVASQNGVVNAEARKAFERAAVLDGDFAKAKFYLALAIEQDGDVEKAFSQLTTLLASLPEGPARMRVQAEIERFQAQGKVPKSGPNSEAGKAIAAMPEEERMKAIRSMVDGLSQRLSQGGGSLAEWRRLIQARLVLGEKDKARAHLAQAKQALEKDAAALESLTAFARDTGLDQPEKP